jgi:predicted nucleotidyltransferase component of viral defense system
MGGGPVKLSQSEVMGLASSEGFDPVTLEKVLQLMNLLNTLGVHPYLKGKWVLKGGTALNLFHLDLPRLSVDIDLNYIGALDRNEMLDHRPRIEEAVQAVFSREGFTVRRVPTDHAGGKWRAVYQSYSGRTGNLEVDMNFMFRQPLWKPNATDSVQLGRHVALGVPILDVHELAAGKLAALLARSQVRDLFDCRQIFNNIKLDAKLLRIGFVAYGGMNRRDWRTVSLDDVVVDSNDLANSLFPTLRPTAMPIGVSQEEYGRTLVAQCREYLAVVLPLNDAEMEFLNLLLDGACIDATLLTDDPVLQARIESHPLLQWKVLNVRQHKGLH